MSFEKEVLAKVAEIINSEKMAEFCYGTLSVICNEDEAKKILKKLNKDYNNKVQMERDASYGYLFDFVA